MNPAVEGDDRKWFERLGDALDGPNGGPRPGHYEWVPIENSNAKSRRWVYDDIAEAEHSPVKVRPRSAAPIPSVIEDAEPASINTPDAFERWLDLRGTPLDDMEPVGYRDLKEGGWIAAETPEPPQQPPMPLLMGEPMVPLPAGQHPDRQVLQGQAHSAPRGIPGETPVVIPEERTFWEKIFGY